ncbi:MAG: SBBP repeat-containing protein [Bacteroidota bacterium]
MTRILFFALAIILLNPNADAQKLDWAKSIGGIGSDFGSSMAVDKTGNVFTTGSYVNVMDADPGPSINNLTTPGRSPFVLKQNASGNYIWAITFPTSGNCYGTGIVVSNTGSIYVSGYFDKATDFDPGLGNTSLTPTIGGSIGSFLSKYDNMGNFVWAKYIGEGASSCINNVLSFDNKGNLLLAGDFNGNADLDPSPGTTFIVGSTSASFPDSYISKLDTNGDFIWAVPLQGLSVKSAAALASDTSGSVYCSGTFQGTVDFDPTGGVLNLSSKGLDDIFVAKYNSMGLVVWAKSIGGIGAEKCKTIAVDKWKNIYLSGLFANTVDFDPGTPYIPLSSVSAQDLFICKLDNSANLKWAKQAQSNSNAGTFVAVDTLGYVYNTGNFGGTVDFDPGTKVVNLTASGGDDIFIGKFDSTGNFVWSRKIGGVSQDIVNTIAVDQAVNIYLCGSFYDSCDFDPGASVLNLKAVTVNDAFIFKMKQCTTPLNKTVTLSSGILTSAESVPATFQWINCATKMPVPGATSKTFTVPATGSFAVVIDKNNCLDTSDCFSANGSGIINVNNILDGMIYYPNPGSGKLTIELGGKYDQIALELSNLIGQKVSEKTYQSTDRLDYFIAGPAGIYFMKISIGTGASKTIKLLKE